MNHLPHVPNGDFLTTACKTLQNFWEKEAKSEIAGIVRQSSRTKRAVKAWCYHEPLPVGSSSQLLLVAGLPAFTLQWAKAHDHLWEEAGWAKRSLAETLCKRDPPLQENSNTSELWHLQVWQFSCRCTTTQGEAHLFPYFHHGLMSVWFSYSWCDMQKLQNDRVLMLLGSLKMCHAFSIYQQRGEESPGPGFMTLVGFCYSTTTIKQ